MEESPCRAPSLKWPTLLAPAGGVCRSPFKVPTFGRRTTLPLVAHFAHYIKYHISVCTKFTVRSGRRLLACPSSPLLSGCPTASGKRLLVGSTSVVCLRPWAQARSLWVRAARCTKWWGRGACLSLLGLRLPDRLTLNYCKVLSLENHVLFNLL